MSDDYPSPQELRNQHPCEKKLSDFQNHFWAYLVLRPVSFYLAAVFIRLGITANQITYFGGVLLMIGFFLMTFQTYNVLVILGAVFVNIWLLIDFVDGVVARYNQSTSIFGAYVDWLIGMVFHTVLPFVVAVVLFRTGEFEVFTAIREIPELFWLILAVLNVIFYLFRRASLLKARNISPQESNELVNKDITPSMVIHAVRSFQAPLVFVSLLIGILDLWLIFYTFYNVSLLGPAIFYHLNRLR